MEGWVGLAARGGREICWYDLHGESHPGRSHGSTMVYPLCYFLPSYESNPLFTSENKNYRFDACVVWNFERVYWSHLFCTPSICSDIFSQNVLSIASQYEHLQNLTLADSSPDGDKRNNILVGVDFIIHVLIVKLKEVMETSLLPLVLFLFGFEAAVMKLKEMFTII